MSNPQISHPFHSCCTSWQQTQRNFSGVLLNQHEIRLHLPFSDWIGSKRSFVWIQINRKMVNKIWFRLDLIRFWKKLLCVYGGESVSGFGNRWALFWQAEGSGIYTRQMYTYILCIYIYVFTHSNQYMHTNICYYFDWDLCWYNYWTMSKHVRNLRWWMKYYIKTWKIYHKYKYICVCIQTFVYVYYKWSNIL